MQVYHSLSEGDCGPQKGPGCIQVVWGWEVAQLATGLTAEAIQRAALSLQSVHHVHGCDSLALGVLSVGDGIPDDILQEHLEHTAGLLVDETGDTLHAASASQTTDGGLGDALDVVAENLAVALGASLSESLASLAAASHGAGRCVLSCSTVQCAVPAPFSGHIYRARRPAVVDPMALPQLLPPSRG